MPAGEDVIAYRDLRDARRDRRRGDLCAPRGQGQERDKDAGKPLEPIAAKMNEMAQKYHDNSRPECCPQHGFVDEVVDLKAFAGAAYQNPASIRPRHQMLLPRVIKG